MDIKNAKNKIAAKAAGSDKVRESWAMHEATFGPILAPSFTEDPEARIILTAALNFISRRDASYGMKKLDLLEDKCKTDADRAALLFSRALAYEISGEKEKAVENYSAACKLNDKFYLPFLKIAKFAHENADFDTAKDAYRKAIACMGTDPETAVARASAYTNLTSCLTMMRKFEDAEKAFANSCRILGAYPGREASAAILYAAKGDIESMEKYLLVLEKSHHPFLSHARITTDQILAGKNAQFSPLPIKDDMVAPFWEMFRNNEEALSTAIAEGKKEEWESFLAEKFALVFPFAERKLRISAVKEGDVCRLFLSDFYAIALENGYKKLLAAIPADIAGRWSFKIVH